jgi:SecD/SecF fusion protein
MKMNSEGARIWKRMTADNVGRQIAITVDGVVYVHPTVQSQIEGGNSNITGNFTREEVNDLALVLNSGKYPVKLNILKTEVIEVKK